MKETCLKRSPLTSSACAAFATLSDDVVGDVSESCASRRLLATAAGAGAIAADVMLERGGGASPRLNGRAVSRFWHEDKQACHNQGCDSGSGFSTFPVVLIHLI
jgi:hypothetical protein